MLVAEQELAVEVAEVDGVEVDDVDLAKAGEDQVLEELAADAPSSDHQDARLGLGQPRLGILLRRRIVTSLMRWWSAPPRLWRANLSRAIAGSVVYKTRS